MSFGLRGDTRGVDVEVWVVGVIAGHGDIYRVDLVGILLDTSPPFPKEQKQESSANRSCDYQGDANRRRDQGDACQYSNRNCYQSKEW